MYKDPTEFRKRFAAWKNGKQPYKNGKPLSDEEYVRIMENVAANNWQQWGEDSEDAALTRILNDNSYNYRGYYDEYPNGKGNATDHWTDEFKTVWHPSFSTESRYSGKKSQYNPNGLPGGTWLGEFFTPQWYLQNPNASGFYKDGYPRLPMYKNGKNAVKFSDNQKNGKQPYKAGQVDKAPHEAFVELMGPTLYKELLRTNTSNIDAAYDYMLRQLAYESDYGRSRVAREQHNYGGYGWNGRTYTTFKDDADFVKHYVQLMNNRYGSAVNADSIQSYARALKDKGYYEDSLDNYTRNLAGMTSLSKSAKDHMLNNPTSYLIQPLSLAPITESLERVPLFLPIQTYASTDNTDYSLQNASIQSSAPRNINAWSGANSPAYGGNSIRMPSLLEYMQTGSVLPVGFKNGKLPGYYKDGYPRIPKYKDGKLPKFGDGTPTRVGDYNVYPSAIGASELSVTTPEIVIKPRQKYPDTSDYYMWNPSNFTFLKYLDRKIQQLRSLEGGDNEKVAQRIYNTITPRVGYLQPYNLQGLINARKQYENNVQRKFLREGVESDLLGRLYMNRNRTREAQFAKYLGLPTFKYNLYDDGVYEDSVNTYLRPARYIPTKGNPLGDLVMLPRHESYEDELSDLNLAALYRSAQKGDSIVNFQNSVTLGNYSGGIGKDSLGNYISYYDEWDINPLKGENSKDLFLQYGIGHPFSLYDRRYFSLSELKRALKKYDKAHTDRLLYDQTH